MARTEAIVPAAAAIGTTTGIVSSLPLPDPVPPALMRELPDFVQGLVHWVVFFNPVHGGIPWQAPYAFAVGIFMLLTIWGGIDRRRAMLILPTSLVAWDVVWTIAIALALVFGPAAATSPKTHFEWILDWFAGLACGFAGAALTAAGLWWISKRLRSGASVLMIAFTGALAGALLNVVYFIDALRPHAVPVTFVIWQTSVAVAIAWQLSRRARDFGLAPHQAHLA